MDPVRPPRQRLGGVSGEDMRYGMSFVLLPHSCAVILPSCHPDDCQSTGNAYRILARNPIACAATEMPIECL